MFAKPRMWLLMAGAALAGVCALATGPWSRADTAGEHESQAPLVGTTKPWLVGEVHRYHVELRNQIQAQAASLVAYDLTAELQVRVLRVDRAGVTLQAQLVEPVLRAHDTVAPVDSKKLQQQGLAEFAEPLTYRFDSDGVFIAVVDAPQQEVQARSMLRAIVAATQVIQDTSASTWQASERDGTGEYTAAYEREAPASLAKRKLRYTKLHPQMQAALGDTGRMEVVSSAGGITLREHGLPKTIELHETLQAAGDSIAGLSSVTDLTLSYIESAKLTGDQLARAQTTVPSQLVAPNEYKRAGTYTAAGDRARLQGRSFDDLMALLAALPASQKDYSENDQAQRRQAFIGLAASYRQAPENVARALSLIEQGSPWSRLLSDTLGSAGTPEAQAALRKLIDMSRFSEQDRLTQLIDLSLADTPTPETVHFLEQRKDDREQHAQVRFSLGTAAFRLRDSAPREAAAIIDVLRAGLQQANSLSSRIEYLRALGNSGNPAALDTLLEHVHATVPGVRSAALDALRFIANDRADAALIDAMRDDPSGIVRVSAVRSASWRPAHEPLLAALLRSAAEDPDADVRQGALASVARMSSREPELLKRLESTLAP
jgi:HEAT repeat protein